MDGTQLKPEPALAQSQKIVFLTSPLSSEEYDDYMSQTDCMVLPYHRQSYYARTSGVAVEAATAGIPIIFTKDTWMEDAVSQYGAGIGIEDKNALDLAEKIELMVSKIDEYKEKAMARAKIAQAYHSPENFLKCLWGDAGQRMVDNE